MRALSEADFEREAQDAFRRVFVTPDPFDSPFATDIESRTILFPVHYRPEPRTMHALIAASELVGDTAFYLSVLERPAAKDQNRAHHWHVPLSDIAAYHSLAYPFVLENAIYSPRGLWGMMFSHERHALLGGRSDFMDAVRQRIPRIGDEAPEFLRFWKDNEIRFGSNTAWLPPLLCHIYGEQRAGELLKDTSFAYAQNE